MKKDGQLFAKIISAFFGAIAFGLMLVEIPIISAFPWLKYDISDIPVLLTGFKFGIPYGIMCVLIRNILFYLFKGDGFGLLGFVSSLAGTLLFIIPAVFIYYRKKTYKSAIVGLITGIVIMAAGMIPVNILIISILFEFDNQQIIRYIIYGVVPFNFIKGVINSIILIVIYKKIWKILKI
ncbi:MAG: ECF transporter S component [Candidatus Muiribacteriota bacterium]